MPALIPPHVVVVGGGVAGVAAAEYLLRATPPPRVTLLTAAPTLKCARVAATVTRRLCIYDLVEAPADGSFAAAAAAAAPGGPQPPGQGGAVRASADAHAIAAAASTSGSTVRRATVLAVKPACQTVTLDDGTSLGYDALILATGARSAVPPCLTALAPPAASRVLTLRDGDSVDRLTTAIAGARSVALLGNGGIALELAWAVTGADVVWVVRDAQVGGGVVDATVGGVLRRRLEAERAGGGQEDDALGGGAPGAERGGGAEGGVTTIQRPAATMREVPVWAPASAVLSGDSPTPATTGGVGAPSPTLPRLGGGAVGPDWLAGRDTRYGTAPKRPRLVGAAGRSVSSGSGGAGGSLRICADTEVVGADWDAAAAAAGAPPLVLQLSTGEAVSVDWVVAATGVTPLTELAVAAGIAVDGVDGAGEAPKGDGGGGWGGRAGVVCAPAGDGAPPLTRITSTETRHPCPGGILVWAPGLATSAPRVFAAGDCTTVLSSPRGGGSDGLWHQMRLWSQARVAGAVAARSALRVASGDDGDDKEDDDDDDGDLSFELIAHVTWFMGAKVVLLGRYGGQGLPPGYTVYEADGEDGGEGGPGAWARAIVGPTGRLVGGVLVGETGLEEAYENLMLDRLDVSGVGERLVAGGGVDLADYYD